MAELSRRVRRLLEAGPPRKELADCCRARRDKAGRYPVGFCSPGCIRRPENWRKACLAGTT